MEKLNEYLTRNIYSVNKCILHYGKYLVNDKDIIFDKKINKTNFDELISKFVTNKYNVDKKIIYNYKNYFYDVSSNSAYKKIKNKNFNNLHDKLLIEVFNEEKIDVPTFSCRKEYDNIYEYELTRISLADELKLNFIQENNFYTFSIEINVDANIDNTIKKLNKLLTIL